MKTVHLTRAFLKKPLYSIGLLLCMLLIIEGLGWTIAYRPKLATLVRAGGFFPYISLFFRSLFLPEICTVVILTMLLNRQHVRFKINSVGLTLRDISRYELSFLPTILLAFFLFNPATQTVRYFLEAFPNYNFSNYWHHYLSGTFTLSIYLRYLMPVFLIGYITINVSFISDYFKQRQQAQDKIENQAAEAIKAAQAIIDAKATPSTTPAPVYLSALKGKNATGELGFRVEEVYFFTTEDRYYYAQLAKGQYLISKTLNELETELDPTLFFRIKRDYIVNRHAVLNYAYWENGKYIVRLNTSERHEIVVPRARMQEFRDWLQGNQRPFEDTSSDSLVLIS